MNGQTPPEVPRRNGTGIPTDDEFAQHLDTLPSWEQLAEVALEAERRGVETGQPSVVHVTVWREQGPAIRLYLMTNHVWWQVRAPQPYSTEVKVQIGEPRSRRRTRKG